MAKQISMIKFTGKLGEMVGQKDAYGKAIIRQRVENPKNPKTTAQAGQRYKLLPAQRIAGALKEIIERGQQGVKYGLESRNLFMKRALKMTTGFPYMEKDDPNIIPGEYQLTKGTLPEIVCSKTQGADFLSGLKQIDNGVGHANNFGEVSQALIEANPFLQNGDQITVVGFAVLNGRVLSAYHSVVLDTESTSTGDDYNLFFGSGSICALSAEDNATDILVINTGGTLASDVLCACAMIISRPNGANGYLRSNATLFVDKTNATIAKYFTATGQSDALKTYEGDTSISNNTNWPVDIDGDGGSGSSGFVSISADADDPIPEGSTLTGLGRYAVGETVTLQYSAGTSGYDFDNWKVNGVDMPALTQNPWTFTAQRNIAVSVNGTLITPP